MGLHFMIRKEKNLRCLFRLRRIVMVLFIRFRPLFIITLLPNQQGHIPLRVIHDRFPLVLKILITSNEVTVPFQLTLRQ
jgi:hypothetical protein